MRLLRLTRLHRLRCLVRLVRLMRLRCLIRLRCLSLRENEHLKRGYLIKLILQPALLF